MTDPAGNSTEQLKAFVIKHKLALGIGAVVLAMLAAADGGQQQSDGQPVVSDGGGSTDPGFDMDKWKRDQARDDREQQNRIDTIREEENCPTPNGVEKVPAGTCTGN